MMQNNTILVKNMLGRTGKPVVNQFVIMTTSGFTFQSYNSRICSFDVNSGELFFGPDWNYSRTTTKYLVQFLRVYVPDWYARLIAGKRSFSANVQQAIVNNTVQFVQDW